MRPAQIWSPATDKWSPPLASDRIRRGYHSTAILLPDGRVLSAGGESFGTNPNYDKPTIYCPPYLFDANGNLATRPTITSVPDTMNWGRRFTIKTPEAASITSACLIRPGAVTHAFNQDQRYVPLTIVERCGDQLIVVAPADSNVAPPGYYLVFVLQGSVPAIAKWSQIMSRPAWDGADIVRPAPVSDLFTAANRTSAIVTWISPGDDSLCAEADEFDLRVSPGVPIDDSNFHSCAKVTTAAPGSPGTEHCIMVDNLSQCTWHYFAIKTRDDRYQWSAISNVASVKTKCSGSSGYMCEEGGEGLMAQGGGGDGNWQSENRMLPGLAAGRMTDLLLLDGETTKDGLYTVRLARTGSSLDLDEARVGIVEHESGESIVAGGGTVYVGALGAVERVLDETGADVGAVVSGEENESFSGQAGGSLTVDLPSDEKSTVLVVEWAGSTGSSAGLIVQRPLLDGSWEAVAELWPRRGYDRVAVEVGGSRARIAFVRDGVVRSIQELNDARAVEPTWLETADADHSRLGDVAAGGAVALRDAETLTLHSTETALAPGKARDHVLFLRAAPSSRRSTALQSSMERDPIVRFRNTLGAAQPNPSAGGVRIGFTLARGAQATMSFYDPAGRIVRRVAMGALSDGAHEMTWDRRTDSGDIAAPGVYLYQLTAGSWSGKRKLVLSTR